jgi:hypothetical protein
MFRGRLARFALRSTKKTDATGAGAPVASKKVTSYVAAEARPSLRGSESGAATVSRERPYARGKTRATMWATADAVNTEYLQIKKKGEG